MTIEDLARRLRVILAARCQSCAVRRLDSILADRELAIMAARTPDRARRQTRKRAVPRNGRGRPRRRSAPAGRKPAASTVVGIARTKRGRANEEAVLRALMAAPNGLARQELARKSKIKYASLYPIIARLARAGRVEHRDRRYVIVPKSATSPPPAGSVVWSGQKSDPSLSEIGRTSR